jgi:hypothetical protein
MSESETEKRIEQGGMAPVPPPTWAARREWLPIAPQPSAEYAASFTDHELTRLKFTKWLIETGRLIP